PGEEDTELASSFLLYPHGAAAKMTVGDAAVMQAGQFGPAAVDECVGEFVLGQVLQGAAGKDLTSQQYGAGTEFTDGQDLGGEYSGPGHRVTHQGRVLCASPEPVEHAGGDRASKEQQVPQASPKTGGVLGAEHRQVHARTVLEVGEVAQGVIVVDAGRWDVVGGRG